MRKESKAKTSKDKYNRELPKAQGQNFIDRDLVPVNPLVEQFEPTEAEPIVNTKRMAGVS